MNGKDYRLTLDPRTTLLDCLRETIGLTGDEEGLRSRPVRRLHRARQRLAGELVPELRADA